MRIRPVVGIISDRTVSGMHPSHVVGEKYIAGIVDGSNALAMLLPALGTRQCIEDILSVVDGLLFTGSYSNVEPRRYGGHPSSADTLHDAARDATTLPLMRAAIERGVPVLGICRGFEEMNVVFGGTLYQNVHAVHGYADHRENKEHPLDLQYGPAHPLRIIAGGLLHQYNGSLEAHVNSLHAQGIERLGDGLAVEAVAPDGLVEAISVNGACAFALGVQWHPEWRHANNALSTAIFSAFGDACRDRMRIKGDPVSASPLEITTSLPAQN